MGISCPHQAPEYGRERIVCRGQRKRLLLTSKQCLDLLSHFKDLHHISLSRRPTMEGGSIISDTCGSMDTLKIMDSPTTQRNSVLRNCKRRWGKSARSSRRLIFTHSPRLGGVSL